MERNLDHPGREFDYVEWHEMAANVTIGLRQRKDEFIAAIF